jgi:hypothetical protein
MKAQATTREIVAIVRAAAVMRAAEILGEIVDEMQDEAFNAESNADILDAALKEIARIAA